MTAPTSSQVYPQFLQYLLVNEFAWGGDSMIVLLLDESYEFAVGHATISDVVAHEITASGYARQAITNPSTSISSAGAGLGCDPVTLPQFAGNWRWLVVADAQHGSDAADFLVCAYDFGTQTAADPQQWSPNPVLQFALSGNSDGGGDGGDGGGGGGGGDTDPPGDGSGEHFANRHLLAGQSDTFTVTITDDFAPESGEPDYPNPHGAPSAWAQWTCPDGFGHAQFDTGGSAALGDVSDTCLAVYTAADAQPTLADLTQVAFDDDGYKNSSNQPTGESLVIMAVVPGTVYYLKFGPFNTARGPVKINVTASA